MVTLFFLHNIDSIGASSLSLMPPSCSSTASNTNDTTLNEVSVLNAKGVSLNGLGKFNESITYFDKVLASNQNNALALNEKGNALGGLGNYTEAMANYDKALEVNPKNATYWITKV